MSTEDDILIGTIEAEVEINVSPSDFHHMFTHKPHHISNASSDIIQGCELHEGEWGSVGSIIFWNYHHDGQARVAKERIEAIDHKKNMITFSVIEGDLLEHFKSFVVTLTAKPIPAGKEGCVVHWHIKYEKLHAEIIDPHTLIQLAIEVSKDIEVHIREDKKLESAPLSA